MTPFEHWWYHEGSQGPTAGNDMEEHCKRMCQIAWDNGAFKEREASFRAGFYAGFSYSGEGWNGEYPFQYKNRPIIGDQLVEAALTAALAERNQS